MTDKKISLKDITYENAGITLKELLLQMNTANEFPGHGWAEVSVAFIIRFENGATITVTRLMDFREVKPPVQEKVRPFWKRVLRRT